MKTQRPLRKRVSPVFADNLQKLMKERRLSLRQAAKICGVSPAVFHAWTQGGAPQDLQAVLNLCSSMKIDFQWLLTGKHSAGDLKNLNLSDFFEMEEEPGLSGIFVLKAQRLKRRRG